MPKLATPFHGGRLDIEAEGAVTLPPAPQLIRVHSDAELSALADKADLADLLAEKAKEVLAAAVTAAPLSGELPRALVRLESAVDAYERHVTAGWVVS